MLQRNKSRYLTDNPQWAQDLHLSLMPRLHFLKHKNMLGTQDHNLSATNCTIVQVCDVTKASRKGSAGPDAAFLQPRDVQDETQVHRFKYLLARLRRRSLRSAAHGEGGTWLSDVQRGILGTMQPWQRSANIWKFL